jgi:hypothetical protein
VPMNLPVAPARNASHSDAGGESPENPVAPAPSAADPEYQEPTDEEVKDRLNKLASF